MEPSITEGFILQGYTKLSITEKRQNKTKYLTWNSTGFTFVKNSMPNPVKNLGVSPKNLQLTEKT